MKRKLTAFAAAFALAALAGIAHAQQTPAPQPAKAENAAERKPIYYRNPMGLPDISLVPKKDSMGMDYIPVYADEATATSPGTVSISLDRVQRTGVRTERAEQRLLVRPVRAPGVAKPDEHTLHAVSLRVDAFIEKLYVEETGAHIRAGQPLFRIYSPAMVSAQVDYRIAAPDTDERARAASVKAPSKSCATCRSPRPCSTNCAAPASRSCPSTGPRPPTATSCRRTPSRGRWCAWAKRSSASLVSTISGSSPRWPSRIWGWSAIGQPVTVRFRALPGDTYEGHVTFVLHELDPATRTGKVRIELANPQHRIKHEMYADVEIDAAAGEPPRLAVPNSSILDSGNAQVVLLSRGEGRFEPRTVALGLRGQDYTEVTSGIEAGDEVVVAANFLIDAESNLKAALSAFSPIAATPAPAAQPPSSAAAPERSHGSHP